MSMTAPGCGWVTCEEDAHRPGQGGALASATSDIELCLEPTLGHEPYVRTLPVCSSASDEEREMILRWDRTGHRPARQDPGRVPDDQARRARMPVD